MLSICKNYEGESVKPPLVHQVDGDYPIIIPHQPVHQVDGE